MALNEAERHAKFDQERDLLSSAWQTLFPMTDEGLVENRLNVLHPPPAFGHMMNEVMNEVEQMINQTLNEAGLEGEDRLTAAGDLFGKYMMSIATKVYRLGNYMAVELPWERMTPCGCTSPSDEELEHLLSAPFDLEGKGWVIKGFEHRKEVKE